MRCPYCVAEVPAEAVVCQQCRRDFYLFKPLQQRIEELEKELRTQSETLTAQYDAKILALEARIAAGAASPLSEEPTQPRSYINSLLMTLVPALVLLVAAHAILLFVYDVKPLYLRVASMVIPVPFAFALYVWHPRRLELSALYGFAMAFAAVAAMLFVTAKIDNVPFLPADLREWRETIEYVLSIGLATLTGLLLGRLRYKPIAGVGHPGRLVTFFVHLLTSAEDGEPAIMRMANRLQKLVNTFTPIATAAASIYAGVKALMGDG